MRAEMFRWLNGPGSAFRHPLPGSTNYLNAYDRYGDLIRAKDRSRGRNQEDTNEDERGANKEDETDEDGGIIAKRTRKIKAPKNAPALPKESTEDLMPYPMNPHFRSQHVLSEELKDAIYERVMVGGQSVRNVSAILGVEMNRVGAVVRLKALEKEWEKEVCHMILIYLFKKTTSQTSMMRKNQFD